MKARVKICGIRREEDAEAAVALGASAVGLVFWPSSPRFVEPDRARSIVGALPPFVTAIGVFVDQPPDYVQSVVRLLNLGAVQLHGREDVERYSDVGCRVIKSVAVSAGFEAASALALVPPAVTVLLDAHDPIRRGGTGQTIDWNAAAAAARLRTVVLSGGLHAGNVREAVDIVRPYAVDVSSGVESAPGVKDAGKMRAFFAALE